MKQLTRKDGSRRRHPSASDARRDRPHASEVTGTSISCSSTCLSEVKGPRLLLKRHTVLFGDHLESVTCGRDAIGSWSDLSGRVPASLRQTTGNQAPPTPPSPHGQLLLWIVQHPPVWLRFHPCKIHVKMIFVAGTGDPSRPLDLLRPQNADKIAIKIADLGNACWVVSKHVL